MDLNEYTQYLLFHLNRKTGLDELSCRRLMRDFGFKDLVKQTNGKALLYPPNYWADAILRRKEGVYENIQDLLI